MTRIVVLLCITVCAAAQTEFELQANTEYVLRVPAGYDKWPLIADSAGGGAQWCYVNRANRPTVQTLCIDKAVSLGATYAPDTLAMVTIVGKSSVNVVLKDGRSGWVARELVDMTQEQRKSLEEQQAKEQAYIASLPKLRSGSSEVLVATSTDCARDYKTIVEFGRRNGTGVEYRKKILELISLGCAKNLPSGTAITVSHRDKDFVEFCAYDGPKKGTCGVALAEHVH